MILEDLGVFILGSVYPEKAPWDLPWEHILLLHSVADKLATDEVTISNYGKEEKKTSDNVVNNIIANDSDKNDLDAVKSNINKKVFFDVKLLPLL